MKRLMKIKLINWHGFVNETVEVNGNCVITGENGAGKSTLLDAVQYVITGGKVKFNSAANMKARRDLEGYVRCKIGTDKKTYLREGDVTSHVALEFYDDLSERSVVLGVAIDVSSNQTRPKEQFYCIDDKRITEAWYIKDRVPVKINDFKKIIRNFSSTLPMTKGESRLLMLNKLDINDVKYVELLPKALAFKPIDNVKDFVYNFLLDDKPINIDKLRETTKAYHHFGTLLCDVKTKLDDLQTIVDTYKQLEQKKKQQNLYKNIVTFSERDLFLHKIGDRTKTIESLQEQINERKDRINGVEVEQKKLDVKKKELIKQMSSLGQNNEKEEIKNKILVKEEELKGLKQQYDYVLNQLKTVITQLEGITEQLTSKANHDLLYELKQFELNQNHIDKFRHILQKIIDTYDDLKEKNREKLMFLKQKEKELNQEVRDKRETLTNLEQKEVPYRREISELRQTIQEEIRKQGYPDFKVHVFCECLEINDDLWRDAIEGYLNSQRFDLIVSPQFFDKALTIYEQVKFKKKIYGVGLVNTGKISIYKGTHPGSLSSKVDTNNIHARLYANMLLNRVVCCEQVNELKNHRTAITPTCMVYNNYTARQIHANVYKTPFIGRDAIKKQVTKYRDDLNELTAKKYEIEQEISKVNGIIEQLGTKKLYEILSNTHYIRTYYKELSDLNDLKEAAEHVELDDHYLTLERNLDTLDETSRGLNKQINELYTEIGSLKKQKSELSNELNDTENKMAKLDEEIDDLIERNHNHYTESKEAYNEMLKEIEFIDVIDQCKKQLDENQKTITSLYSQLKVLKNEYNYKYQSSFDENEKTIKPYIETFEKIKNSTLLDYEEKVQELREKTELEFKEHFIAKLQENIKKSHKEIRVLNEALEGKQFGKDAYQFVFTPSRGKEKYYKLIMDDSILENFSLYSDVMDPKSSAILHELLEKITEDDKESESLINDFTDYRKYMDYDIKILHDNGDTSSFSKVCREKSGGETQTPYYVIIAASFVKLFNQDSAGIVLYDEAFNNMDESRIQTMMEFYQSLNMQMMIAVPPQRMETLMPYMSTVLVVIKEKDYTYIEPFNHHF
ncbi:ATP-binding protein [Haloplasma contractile]|uniref:ATPase protein n=1 Tax=Haloplasma contractile SSD-17B TaxID=1033810 RepID=F7Q1E6_9MOLU|nr:SbcC/MukB-like Walker B domain-containing protein [Haloplasma contractile]ERJ12865.1 ATPase protein [Haloplasma contractile SSD-17B]